MGKVVLAEAFASFLKFIATPLYFAWAVKLFIVDYSGVNILISLVFVTLSVYGLWALAQRASDWFERSLNIGKSDCP